jgi:hypothetical protein
MPASVEAELLITGLWEMLVSVLPALATTARVTRASTSAGLRRTDTGERLPGSGGLHIYLLVKDGTDIPRFLRALHDRCWLAGYGWYMVGAGGQLLERSIVDRMVGASERLIFEGAPICVLPVEQDIESRRPVAVHGDVLDTMRECPPLMIAENARLSELKTKAAHRLAGEIGNARADFIAKKAKHLSDRTGMPLQAAKRTIERQCEGVLLPGVELIFDDPELAGCTVADVLARPADFEGATLADPLEGIEYGRCKAIVLRRRDGSPWIHSFAHGRTIYNLRLDAEAARAALEAADPSSVIETLIELAAVADLNAAELEELIELAANRSGTGKRSIAAAIKDAQKQRDEQRKSEEQDKRFAERRDPRPMLIAPAADDPWLPQMETLNEVLGRGQTSASIPPTRDINGVAARARKAAVPNTHAFTNANDAQEDGQTTPQLPPPEQWVISCMNEMEVAEMIEKHIDFVEPNGRSVHLPMPFVRHYVKRDDSALPFLAAISTAPLVLADGRQLAPDGLDRERGIAFIIAKELRKVVPEREDCDASAARKAMQFLCDEWLVDVATDFAGKCTVIAAALTIIERSLLPERLAFFVTAGKRGGGKTTLLNMLIMAVTGLRATAGAWSSNEEERRKALLGYFLSGMSYILWDNIPRGSKVSCPHIERSCTSASYADRRLGVSETVETAASAVHLFTGNNIAPKGDLASRSLCIRLAVDRHDPENRPFKHPDPIGWTEQHRAEILAALYTTLLGNPMLAEPQNTASRTRFKLWWRLVGSAVEHGARLLGQELDFQKLFLDQEHDNDEEAVDLAAALNAMNEQWSSLIVDNFKAAEVADFINYDDFNPNSAVLREFLLGRSSGNEKASAKTVGRKLRNYVDSPVLYGGRTLTLCAKTQRSNEVVYFIETT